MVARCVRNFLSNNCTLRIVTNSVWSYPVPQRSTSSIAKFLSGGNTSPLPLARCLKPVQNSRMLRPAAPYFIGSPAPSGRFCFSFFRLLKHCKQNGGGQGQLRSRISNLYLFNCCVDVGRYTDLSIILWTPILGISTE